MYYVGSFTVDKLDIQEYNPAVTTGMCKNNTWECMWDDTELP